jgi:hypothetical protein
MQVGAAEREDKCPTGSLRRRVHRLAVCGVPRLSPRTQETPEQTKSRTTSSTGTSVFDCCLLLSLKEEGWPYYPMEERHCEVEYPIVKVRFKWYEDTMCQG